MQAGSAPSSEVMGGILKKKDSPRQQLEKSPRHVHFAPDVLDTTQRHSASLASTSESPQDEERDLIDEFLEEIAESRIDQNAKAKTQVNVPDRSTKFSSLSSEIVSRSLHGNKYTSRLAENSCKDIDEMDAALFGFKPKPSSRLIKTSALKRTELTAEEAADARSSPSHKKPSKFTFNDDDDDDDDDDYNLMNTLVFDDDPKDRTTGVTLKKARAFTRLDEILGTGASPVERVNTMERNKRTQPKISTENSSDSSDDLTLGEEDLNLAFISQARWAKRQRLRSSLTSAELDQQILKPDIDQDEEECKSEMAEPSGTREEMSKVEKEKEDKTGRAARMRESHVGEGQEERRRQEESRRLGKQILSSRETPQREFFRLDEILGFATSPCVMERSATTEMKIETQPETPAQRQVQKRSNDCTFSSNQQTKSASPQEHRANGQQLWFEHENQHTSEWLDLKLDQGKEEEGRKSETTERLGICKGEGEGGTEKKERESQQSQKCSSVGYIPDCDPGGQHMTVHEKRVSVESGPQWGLFPKLQVIQKSNSEKQTVKVASLQAKILLLEGQVRSLQLERDQLQMCLDSTSKRHKQDMEQMENTLRSRLKLLEQSGSEREARAQLEVEDLTKRLAQVALTAEEERSELWRQYQRRLAQCQQERDHELDRLRELQRRSILEMKMDHEKQIQRLKRLKDEEIEAVTSATSQTRSMTVIVEQLEHFTHSLELEAKQKDEQLQVLQQSLTQQQKEMAEERTHLKEIIAKMNTKMNEQQRHLQQESWRLTQEKTKSESALRQLEEERLIMAMEREELEKNKTALHEEQQSVVRHYIMERQKLASEWKHLHTVETNVLNEGSILRIVQERTELKLQAGEINQRDEANQRERKMLEKLREELERERESLKASAQDVENLRKLASEKFREGERALHEARRVEAEQQTRLHAIRIETERLKIVEHTLQQERHRIAHYCKEVEKRTNPILGVGGFPTHTVPPSNGPLTGFTPMHTTTQPASLPPPAVNSCTRVVAPEIQAQLALIQIAIQKDREALEEEHFFLESLKSQRNTNQLVPPSFMPTCSQRI